MSEWTLSGKDGAERCKVKKLEYNGEFMGERSLTIRVVSPSPIPFAIGDYLDYRGERFTIDYNPSVLKQARKETYGEGFVYDNIKLVSRQMELVYCDFRDYVVADNLVHFSSLPTFSFYCETIKALTERIQANLDRLYTGEEKWTIVVHEANVSVKRVTVLVDNLNCWEALALVNSKFNTTFTINGRTIEVGASSDVLTGYFQYGKDKGFLNIEKSSDPDQAIYTRVRATGNSTNMPQNYYRNKHMYVYAPITEVFNIYGGAADIHVPMTINGCFTNEIGLNPLSGNMQYRVAVSVDKENWVYATFTANDASIGYSVASTGSSYTPSTARDTFISQLGSGSYQKLYFILGVDKNKWPSSYREYTGIQAVEMGITRLMLPSYPKETSDPYIDSANIAKYGIREVSIIFDGTEGREDIYPTIKGMTASELESAGISVDLDAGDNGKLDEVYSATQITDDGIPAIEGEDKDLPSTFKIVLKDIGFDINDYKGEGAEISMTSGKCESRSFKITSCEKSGNKYELTCERTEDTDLNRYFPYADYNIVSGDTFVITGIEMPDVYILAASERLKTAAEAWLAQYDYTIFSVNPKIDNLKIKRHDDEVEASGQGVSIHQTIREGLLLSLGDEDLGIDGNIFIDKLTIKEGESLIPQYEVSLSNDKTVGTLQRIQQQITNINAYGTSSASGNNETSMSQVNQLIRNIGDSRFLRKDQDDTGNSLWTVNNISGARRGLQTSDYKQGGNEDNLFGKGFELVSRVNADGDIRSRLEVDELLVRIRGFFASVEVREISYLGGNYAFTSAGSRIYFVEWMDGSGNVLQQTADNAGRIHTFRCYLYSDDGTTATINKWKADDQALCETFNIDEGVHEHVANKRYWRRVTGIGKGFIQSEATESGSAPTEYQYVDISMSDCEAGSDYPEAGDAIVQMGNWTDSARQGVICLMVEGENTPAIMEYTGVGANGQHFVLPNPTTVLSPKKNVIYGEFHSVVDTENGNTGEGETVEDKISSLTSQLDDIQNQADKQFDIWFGSGSPLPSEAYPTAAANSPASEWLTDALKAMHVQDIYYDTDREPASNGGRAWRWTAVESNGSITFRWEEITDADTIASIEKIADVASDGKLTGGAEKQRVYIDWMKAVQEYLTYKEQGADYGVDADSYYANNSHNGGVNAYTAYMGAFATLGTFLNGGTALPMTPLIGTPAWLSDLGTETDITGSITIDGNTTTGADAYRAVWKHYHDTLTTLIQVVNERSKELADAAQEDATEALDLLDDIASDGKLDPSEKITVKRDFLSAWHELADAGGILAKAYDNTKSKWFVDEGAYITPYKTAFRDLGTFLNGGTAWLTVATVGTTAISDANLPSWLRTANIDNTEDIAGDTFRTRWSDFYKARTAVLTALSNAAQADATEALDEVVLRARAFFTPWNTLPTPPYKQGDTWTQTDRDNRELTCTTARAAGATAARSDWTDTTDPKSYLSTLAEAVYNYGTLKNTINGGSITIGLGTTTGTVAFNGSTAYVNGSAVSDTALRGALRTAYYHLYDGTARTLTFYGTSNPTGSTYDLKVASLSMVNPFDSSDTFRGGEVFYWKAADGWQMLTESSRGIIENTGNLIKNIIIGTKDGDTYAAGFVAKKDFSALFASAVTSEGVVKQAEIKAFITKDEAGNLISNATIQADKINFSGKTINLDAATFTLNASHINLKGAVTFSMFDTSLQSTINGKANSSDLGTLAGQSNLTSAQIDSLIKSGYLGAFSKKSSLVTEDITQAIANAVMNNQNARTFGGLSALDKVSYSNLDDTMKSNIDAIGQKVSYSALGNAAYWNDMADAMLGGQTFIYNGYIRTSMIDVDNLYVTRLMATKGQIGGIYIDSNGIGAGMQSVTIPTDGGNKTIKTQGLRITSRSIRMMSTVIKEAFSVDLDETYVFKVGAAASFSDMVSFTGNVALPGAFHYKTMGGMYTLPSDAADGTIHFFTGGVVASATANIYPSDKVNSDAQSSRSLGNGSRFYIRYNGNWYEFNCD